ncbi:DinB family protein [Natronoglycomyces albus]|uniref:DinB family protein n=1 Tax=Natronoglycomyces albus TaxID=2811108 RepID=A0A895XPM9_9ACTN|nr:DinB family protein [Natronoglycomyces albus]QSB04486.1 DinB family protein [Natronoglycomyces albus]
MNDHFDGDNRTDPPPMANERATLIGFLRWQRETLAMKCSGLDAQAMATRSVAPSSMSLLGLLRHMADVEHSWFRRIMAGNDIPRLLCTKENPDADFDGAVAEDAVVEEAWRAWRHEVAFAEELVSQIPSLDTPGKKSDPWRGPMSLRWVLIHMIEEYARHNGHADLLRERIDGKVGQ